MSQEIIGVKIQVEGKESVQTVGELRKEIIAAQEEVQKLTDEFGETSKEVAAAKDRLEQLNKKISETGEKSSKALNLKQQLRAATLELQKAQEEFGDFSNEAVMAAKKVARLRDAIKDASELAQIFDPGQKFAAFSGALQAVAGGFAAVQGALGLFGVESKDVEKQLLKVQSALALSQGLSQIGDAADQFKKLGTLIRATTAFRVADTLATKAAAAAQRLFTGAVATTSTAFQALKGAIIGTGIGALVVLIGTVVGKIVEWVNSTEDAEDAQKKLNDQLEIQKGLLEDELKGIEYVTRVRIAKAKLAGKSEEELRKITKEGEEERLAALKKNAEETDRIDQEKRKDEKLKEEDRQRSRDAALQAARDYNDELQKQEAARLEREAADNEKSLQKKKESDAKAVQSSKERAAAEEAAAVELQKLKDAILEEGIKNEYEKQRRAIDNQLAADIQAIQKNEKIKASTKEALIAAYNEKAKADKDKVTEDEQNASFDREIAFQNRLEAMRQEIALNAIENKREKELQAIRNDYAAKRDQITADETLTADQRLELIKALNERQRQELAAQEDAYKLEDANKELERLNAQVENQKLSFEARKAALDEEQAKLQETYAGKTELEEEYTKRMTALHEARQKLKKEEVSSYLQAAQEIAKTLQELSSLVGEQTAAGKAMAIAAATINTISSAVMAYQRGLEVPFIGTVLAPINAAIAVAAGIKQIQKIASVKIPGKGSGGSAPGLSMAAPVAATPQAAVTQIDQKSINDIGSATSNRAYVLESDVSDSQARYQRLNRAARLS